MSQTHAPDDVYRELKKHFSDAEQVALTLLIVTINGWNRIQVGFRAVHPVLTHLTLVGSLIFFFITLPVRERLDRDGLLPTDMPGPAVFASHIQELMARGLAAGGA